MNTEFTPGPWSIARGYIPEVTGWQLVIAGPVGEEPGSRQTVCLITPVSTENDLDRANARLIAAAPDLLAALQEAKKELRLLNVDAEGGQRRNTPANRVIELCEIAIKKATE